MKFFLRSIIVTAVGAVCVGLPLCYPGTGIEKPGPWPDLPNSGERFFTFFVTWFDTDAPELMEYVRKARPEVVQIGWYGPMFHGYAHNPRSSGSPMRLAVTGEREALEHQARINREIHAIDPDIKVIGHFSMTTVICNPEEPYGFIKWYEEEWDEDLMGPRPVDDVREMLKRDYERDKDGAILSRERYDHYTKLCLSSPYTKQLMKRMVEIAIDTGVDGLVSLYNYRRPCACPWCQKEFRSYLAEHYNEQELARKFDIEDIETHTFDQIPKRTPGYPDVNEASELHWAAQHWAATHFKQVYDEVFIDHGRSLKPDLMLGTWNHSVFRHWCERAFLPIEDWHSGENYFWYSGAHYDGDLEAGAAGDAWPELLWMREMFEGKPFIIGKYMTRIRVALAEAVATGGAGTGLRHYFTRKHYRKKMVRHHNFVHENRALYENSRPRSEVGLVLPRQSALNRRPDAYRDGRPIAHLLAEERVLYEFILDQRIDRRRLNKYDVLILPSVLSLSAGQRDAIRGYVENGGAVLVIGDLAVMDEKGRAIEEKDGLFAAERSEDPVEKGNGTVLWGGVDDIDNTMQWLQQLTAKAPLSNIGATWKVRASAFDIPGGLTLHLVNYNHDEGAADGENPIPVKEVPVELNLPDGAEIASVTLISPDYEDKPELDYSVAGGRLKFVVPEIEIYGVILVQYKH